MHLHPKLEKDNSHQQEIGGEHGAPHGLVEDLYLGHRVGFDGHRVFLPVDEDLGLSPLGQEGPSIPGAILQHGV